jgi:PAS domain S-box-containing protein
LTRLNLEQSARQRWSWTILAGSIALLFITAYFILRQRRTHEEIRVLNADLEKRVQERTAELEASNNFLDSVIESVSDPIFVKDRQHRWMLLNDAFCAFIGHPRETLLGKSDHDFFPGEQADVFWAKDELVFDSGTVNLNEELLTTTSGDEHYIQTKKTPFVSADGRPMLVGVIRDLTHYRLYSEAREAALVEAKRLAQLRSEFLAQMSHELRTPLNGILGYAQILERDKMLGERQIAGIQVIRQSGEHLLTLINDILDFSKIDAGKMELYQSDIRLDCFMQDIAGIMRVKADQKRLEFYCALAPDLPVGIYADEKQLRQILLNLLSNAIKFTERGRVSLRVDCIRPGCLRFEVNDTGIGIAADKLETIFQPFEQIAENPHQFRGTGLGLSISRKIARLMGSDIYVESKPGLGSNFGFELEVAVKTEGSPAALPQRVVTGYTGARKTILVVDDIPENRAVVIDMLSPLGFTLIAAADGREGLQIALSQHPDLILMDTIMPLMDGLETTRRLRQLAGCEAIPVITISARASAEDEANSHAAGADAFISKPLEIMRLLAQIGRLLKLEWKYEVAEAEKSTQESLLAPPTNEILSLYHIALSGNVREILRHTEHIIGMDERYRPFAEHLRSLAQGYKTKDILSFVEQHLERKLEE